MPRPFRHGQRLIRRTSILCCNSSLQNCPTPSFSNPILSQPAPFSNPGRSGETLARVQGKFSPRFVCYLVKHTRYTCVLLRAGGEAWRLNPDSKS